MSPTAKKKDKKEEYYVHIESINGFVAAMSEKMDIRDAICLFGMLISSGDCFFERIYKF